MTGIRTLAVDYDVHEIAYLAGGPTRAVDAAVLALVEGGDIAVDRSTGRLSATGTRRSHWLEVALLDGVGPRGYRTVQTLRRRVGDDDRFAGMRARLEGDGLLRRSAHGAHHGWSALALTVDGRRAVRRLRAEPPTHRVAGGSDALRVALGGPAAMSDSSLRHALFDPPAPPRVPSARTLRREARAGLSTSAAATSFWVAGSATDAWGADGAGWGIDWGGGGMGGDGGGGGGGDG